jgi:hypothetical protein
MRALIVLILAAGCGSTSTYRTTRIAKPGKTDWLFGAQAAGAIAVAGPDNKIAPMPELALAARRAVHEKIEVQANTTSLLLKQFRTGSLELAGKARVFESGRWSIAVGAAAGYRIAESGGAIVEGAHVAVPAILGIELGRHQLVYSIAGGYQRWYSSGARPVGIPFLGQSLGFLWQIGKRWALLPEVGQAATTTKNFMTDETRLFHLGIAVMYSR